MKIVLNTPNTDLINSILRVVKNKKDNPNLFSGKPLELKYTAVENTLLDNIEENSADLYLINTPSKYSQKAVDFIKKKAPYTPVILFGSLDTLTDTSGADIYMPYEEEGNPSDHTLFFLSAIKNANNFLINFEKLRKLTTKIIDVIDFGQCQYDPTRRTFIYKEKEIKKLSTKEGGILEILASNFGEIVKKDVILEKVWRESNYFTGRSMDVYITHLRKLFKENEINMEITNVSGIGLILE